MLGVVLGCPQSYHWTWVEPLVKWPTARNCLQTLALKLQLDVSAVCTRMILPCWLVNSHRFSVWLFLSGPHDISIGPESNHCLSLSETCFSTWLMWLSLGLNLIPDWCDSGCWRCLLTMLLMLMFVSDTWSKCLSRHILRPQQDKARKDKNRRRIFFSAVPAGGRETDLLFPPIMS